ncbi:hypothetical protein [Azospirillum endophyticum]
MIKDKTLEAIDTEYMKALRDSLDGEQVRIIASTKRPRRRPPARR